MKYLFLAIVAIVAGLVGYYFGFVSGKQDQVESSLTYHFLANLAVYQALQKGGPPLAEANLRTYIEGDLQTYEFYKKQVPDFGDKNEHLQDFVKQARAIRDQK